MSVLTVHVEGIGWCSPGVADWSAARALLRAGSALTMIGATQSAPSVLPPNERRRAPDAVLLACDIAEQACTMAGRAASDLPCVFASMHGDLAITENMCLTLADHPLELSPTKFHNSVLNAPVGYWTVATHCHAASNAVSASGGSFAAGLFEAAAEACADDRPTLFAAYDSCARGPLAEAMALDTSYGIALVLSPQRGPRTLATLRLRHDGAAGTPTPSPRGTPFAHALPLFAALAQGGPAQIQLASSHAAALAIEVGA
jgi:hypothetical protein